MFVVRLRQWCHVNEYMQSLDCEAESVQTFLDATKYLMDDVRVRVADLHTVADVYVADVYYHSNCLRSYIRVYERAKMTPENEKDTAPTSRKRLLFQKAEDQIDILTQDGHALSLTDIREFVISMGTKLRVFNYITVK